MDKAIHLTPVFETGLVENLSFAEVINANGESETLRLDIYSPTNAPAALRPAVLWFHGGGFRPGNDKRQVYIPMFAQAFAARGYVGIAPDYRVRAEAMQDPAATIADAVADGRQALAFVKTHGEEYGIDTRRIILAGGSAGGILVLNMVHAAPGPLEGVVGIVNLWGSPGEHWRLFETVRADSPATFTVHGTADALLPYRYSEVLNADLERAGTAHTFLTLPGAPHTPLKHFEQIVEAVARFLQETIVQ